MLKSFYFYKSKVGKIIFLFFVFLIIISKSSLVKSQVIKPFAIISEIDIDSIPTISEQILLKNFKDELAKNYDLRYQQEFEIALQKTKNLDSIYEGCKRLKCILETYSGFKQSILFILKGLQGSQILTVIMIGKDEKWKVKHEVCRMCDLSQEEMIKNVLIKFREKTFSGYALEIEKTKSIQKFSNTSQFKSGEILDNKKLSKKSIFKTNLNFDKKTRLLEKKSPLNELQFKISQRRYNKLIWEKIKKELMFFRRKKLGYSIKNLKVRLRLEIDKFGKVIERSLVDKSGSEKFDKTILDTVDILKLPPPMKNLIKDPPYVVTILIQP